MMRLKAGSVAFCVLFACLRTWPWHRLVSLRVAADSGFRGTFENLRIIIGYLTVENYFIQLLLHVIGDDQRCGVI